MPNQVPAHVKQERSRELAAVEADLRDAYYGSLLGRRLRVLVETREEERWHGTSCRYATVELGASRDVEDGRFVEVVAGGVSGERITAAEAGPRQADRSGGGN
jgi:tRNA A37 methylthiotransferase MiaB